MRVIFKMYLKITEVQLNLDKKGESLIDKVPNLMISEIG